MFVRCQSLGSAAAADAAISTDDDWHAGVGGGGGTGITTKVSGQIFEFVRWPSVCVFLLAGVLYRVLVFTEVCASAAAGAYFSVVQVWTLLLYYDSLTLTHSL